METPDSDKFKDSDYLRAGATTPAGHLVSEVWEAIVAREVIIDELAEGGGMNVDEIRSSGYYEASQLVRDLQQAYGIEPYPELDE